MFKQIQKDESLKASKFLKHQFFIAKEDFERFFSKFSSLVYIPVGKVFSKDEEIGGLEDFLNAYATYESRLLSNEVTAVADLRIQLSGAFSLTKESFGLQVLQNGSKLFKPIKPVIQFQLLSFMVGIDHKIHFTFGKDVTYLGLQLLYPQLFIDESQEIKNGLKETDSQNARLFKEFVSFLREETRLLTFTIDQKKVKTQIRITEPLFEKIQSLPKFSQFQMEI
jgi:hypothetical protein